jgi:hypothetical protein
LRYGIPKYIQTQTIIFELIFASMGCSFSSTAPVLIIADNFNLPSTLNDIATFTVIDVITGSVQSTINKLGVNNTLAALRFTRGSCIVIAGSLNTIAGIDELNLTGA